MTDGNWVSSQEAVKNLDKFSDDPRKFLMNLLRAGSVSSRAAAVKRDGKVVKQAPFIKRKSKELKVGFWQAVSHEDWSAGIFGFIGSAPPELFEVGERLHWSATGVEFNWVEVIRQLGANLDKSPSGKEIPANRQLDHDQIKRDAIALRAARPEISKGSAAASIVADLPPHPKTGKRRDQRHIERIISPLWEGGSLTSLR